MACSHWSKSITWRDSLSSAGAYQRIVPVLAIFAQNLALYNKNNRVLLSQALCVIGCPRKFDVQTSDMPSNYVLGIIFVVNIKFPRATYHTIVPSTEELYCLISVYQTRGIVFFGRSDWLFKRGMVSAIHLPAFFWILHVRFSSFLRKKKREKKRQHRKRSPLLFSNRWFKFLNIPYLFRRRKIKTQH